MDKEIERLNSAKSYTELNEIYLNTSREAFLKWVAKNPEGAILTKSREEFEQCINMAEDDYTKAIMTIAVGCDAYDKIEYYNLIQDKFCKMKKKKKFLLKALAEIKNWRIFALAMR